MVIQDKGQLEKLFESQTERRWEIALTGSKDCQIEKAPLGNFGKKR